MFKVSFFSDDYFMRCSNVIKVFLFHSLLNIVTQIICLVNRIIDFNLAVYLSATTTISHSFDKLLSSSWTVAKACGDLLDI